VIRVPEVPVIDVTNVSFHVQMAGTQLAIAFEKAVEDVKNKERTPPYNQGGSSLQSPFCSRFPELCTRFAADFSKAPGKFRVFQSCSMESLTGTACTLKAASTPGVGLSLRQASSIDGDRGKLSVPG
jgi:hypothetical protein